MCLAGGFLLGFFAAGGVLQLVTAVANEMFPKNRGVITSIVMIASSVANYLVISVAGVLTRVGGTNGRSSGSAVQYGSHPGGHPAGSVPERLPEAGAGSC